MLACQRGHNSLKFLTYGTLLLLFSAPARADELWNRADAAYKKKNYTEAISLWTEYLRLHPESSQGYNARGTAWLAKNEFDIAIRDFDDAVRLDPANWRSY